MSLRAARNDSAGRHWPAGRTLRTNALEEEAINQAMGGAMVSCWREKLAGNTRRKYQKGSKEEKLRGEASWLNQEQKEEVEARRRSKKEKLGGEASWSIQEEKQEGGARRRSKKENLGGEARRRCQHKQKNAVLDDRRNWRISYEEICEHVTLKCIVVSVHVHLVICVYA